MNEIISHLQRGEYPQAILQIKKELNHSAPTPAHHARLLNFLGFAYEQSGHLTEALSAYQDAAKQMPHEAEYANNIALNYIAQGQLNNALPYFEKVAQLKPDAESEMNLALLYIENKQFFKAFLHLEKASQKAPHWAVPQSTLFVVIEHLIYNNTAFEFLKDRLNLSQESAFCLTALGIYYHLNHQEKLAENYFKLALKKDANYLDTYRYLIGVLQSGKKYGDALNWALRFHEAEQSFNSAKEVLASLQDPIPHSLEHIHEIRQNLHTFLDEILESRLYKDLPLNKITASRSLNFYHGYHGALDRPLQEKLARFYRLPIPDFKTHFKTHTQRPRVGILSFHLRNHSVMHLLQKAIEEILQTPEFETFLYSVEESGHPKHDAVTEKLKSMSHHFRHLRTDYYSALKTIGADELDILIFTDIGMDSFTYELALQRLAKVQMTMSGHPVTTGMKTMDYFISSKYLETENAQDYYSETLIQLNGLPDYEPVKRPDQASRDRLGLPKTGNLYFCPMTLFKIHPDFDTMLLQLLDRDPEAQILFLQNKPDLHIRLGHRLNKSLGAERAQRVQFLGWSAREVFYQRLMAADVILDSFYFGGGNTAYQAFGLGCPIVTLDLPWNKSRWTQTMYHLMGIHDLIATDIEHYVQLAIRTATDKTWRHEVSQRILDRKHVLFNNPTWSKELVQFCKRLTLQTHSQQTP